MPTEFADGTAIAGIGWTPFTTRSGRSVTGLATEASLNAISDAGLAVSDIDGVVTYCYGWAPDTIWPEELVAALGLPRCNYQLFDSLGGASSCSAVLSAAFAVNAGLCTNVLVYRAMNGASERPRLMPDRNVAVGSRQWTVPFGAVHAAANLGQPVSAYLAGHGLTNRDFAPLAVTQREHARLNTKAQKRDPLTIEEHQASPWIVEPFRKLDCCLVSDGATALVVTSTERARDLRHAPVTLYAGTGGPTPDSIWRGTSPSEIDFAQLYDAFTGCCLRHIEQFGLAGPGDAAAWVADGHAGLDGGTPVNTHGGLLSEAYTQGLGHVVEAVQQLRPHGVRDDLCQGEHTYDRTECRQVRAASLGLVCGQGGESALLLRSTP
ncbi:thiolase C-terminal domain-containing protein [Pseudonocardia spinosispora]|uniref:thiolase C-terminal domain-containing protein n=1 Tax=Pseudonocardia spinosispora TaxID=103441 RepID=UPI00040D7CB1|nr:hypothetical protein [Pseudonocardia spinosispora]